MHKVRVVWHLTNSWTNRRVWFRQQYPVGEDNLFERQGHSIRLRSLRVLRGVGGVRFRSSEATRKIQELSSLSVISKIRSRCRLLAKRGHGVDTERCPPMTHKRHRVDHQPTATRRRHVVHTLTHSTVTSEAEPA